MVDKEWIEPNLNAEGEPVVYWRVVLGPFETYQQAIAVATPIHAKHEEDFGVRIEGADSKGTIRRVVI